MTDPCNIVLIGAGHAHLVALPALRRSLPDARITMIDPAPYAAYSGMLPGVIAGHYDMAQARFDLALIAVKYNVRLIRARVIGFDPVNRIVQTRQGGLSFDLASLDVGIQADMPRIAGFDQYAVAVKPLAPFAERWTGFAAQPGPVTVIGGGVAGVEIALAAAHRIGPKVTVVEAGPRVLTELPIGPRKLLLEALASYNVTVHLKSRVTSIGVGQVVLADGTRIDSALTIGAAGGRPASWLARDLPTDEGGFVTIGADLQVSGHQGIFATGDCAIMQHAPRPRAGVYAVRQGPDLARNLVAAAKGQTLSRHNPQKHHLKIISLGGKVGLATWRGVHVSGPWVWRWKDRIDQRFMSRNST
ncbi:FAD-dependent oxidoreductase [Paracoccus sp. JM45]|uniref:FAD-dependent oxidoreductase n=1 Tax=Paracoccus sp. JM45 TaxID=2283626 RepID=UPI000E6D0D5B|nr:FAD-dependent oxidoreductase [Paracoccus sp. JM45]RJE79704.1 pyridine nucleotide-disulfide oxidoreductase [Paracoccus sp. JM45]